MSNNSDDMWSGFSFALFVVALAIGAIALGGVMMKSRITSDCATIGAFRDGDAKYQCKPVAP